MKKKITFFDKIFSFRESVIRQYIKNELPEYYDKINFKTDFIKRHWMFFFSKSFHLFIIIWLLIFLLYKIIIYQHLISNLFLEWNKWLNLLIWIISSFVIFGFIIYVAKVDFFKKIWVLSWFFISWLNLFFIFPDKISSDFILKEAFFIASVLIFVFLIEIILRSIILIYDILIDYKNDFLVIYPEWLYVSEKEWALYHTTQRIMFDEIVDVSSREKWIFWTLFWYWKLKISIMWTWDDYEFRYCKNISKVPTMLNKKRIQYSEWKKMKNKKAEELHQWQSFSKKNPQLKPLKSRLRDDLIKIIRWN